MLKEKTIASHSHPFKTKQNKITWIKITSGGEFISPLAYAPCAGWLNFDLQIYVTQRCSTNVTDWTRSGGTDFSFTTLKIEEVLIVMDKPCTWVHFTLWNLVWLPLELTSRQNCHNKKCNWCAQGGSNVTFVYKVILVGSKLTKKKVRKKDKKKERKEWKMPVHSSQVAFVRAEWGCTGVL